MYLLTCPPYFNFTYLSNSGEFRLSRILAVITFVVQLINSRISSAASIPESIGKVGQFRQLDISNFVYTGGDQYFSVPVGVYSITVSLTGASGGDVTRNAGYIGYGGKGATISANIPVTPGETLKIIIGGQGLDSAGGFNGGGTTCPTHPSYPSGTGGGASDIRRSPYALTDRLLVAGGGGGGYGEKNYLGNGGDAGYRGAQNGNVKQRHPGKSLFLICTCLLIRVP